jgi:DNA-binding CsgD family transcriptional regulator
MMVDVLTLAPDLESAEFSDGYIDTLSRFVERMAGVGQLDCSERVIEIKDLFADAAADLGFKYFNYHVVRSSSFSSAAGRLPYMISTYPEAWIRHYLAEGYLDDDPVVTELLQNRLPFMWSEIARPEDLSRRQRRLFDEARDAGIADGITLPIHSRDGEIAAVSLIPAGSEDEALAVMRRHQHVLYLMALHYHTEARRVLLKTSLTGGSSRRQSILSPREIEVLEWTAKGKSTGEISSLLSISNKSVEFHIEGAKRKLQVFNRTHAVAKAITLGLLALH